MVAGSQLFIAPGLAATVIPGADDLDPNLYPNDLMSLDLSPGVRRLPSPLDVRIIGEVQTTAVILASGGVAAGDHPATTASPPVQNPLLWGASLTSISNGEFSVTNTADPNFGWSAQGSVAVAPGAATLTENPSVFSGLTQTITIPAGATALRFTVYPNFSPNSIGPLDAFQAALLDPNSGNSLVGAATGLTQTDAFFNVQTSGQTFFGPQVTVDGLSTSGQTAPAGSPLVVTVNLVGLTAGSQATLYLDLLGFGPAGSSARLANVQLLGPDGNHAPVANSDSYATLQGQPLQVSATAGVLANDTDEENDPLTVQILGQPANGTVTLNNDGSFTYIPASGFSGHDSFTYQASDGQLLSQPATVSITVSPNLSKANQTINFAPLADVTYGVLPITLGATATSGDAVSFSVLSGPATLTGNVLTVTGIGKVVVEASQAGDANYNAAPVADESFTVAPAPLTVTATASNKVYDATTVVTVFLIANPVNGDVLTVGYITAAFADRNVGTAKTVNISGITIAGTNMNDYTLENNAASVTATITPAPLIITAVTNTKTYDSTTTAAATPTVSGLQGSDAVTGLAESYSDANAGTGKTLSVSAYLVNDGNGGKNYLVTTAANSMGVITKTSLTITAMTNTKTYDGATSATATPTVSGLLGSDTATGLAEVYTNPNAGTSKTLSVSAFTIHDGNGGNNYSVTTVNNTTGTINKASLTITALTSTKAYDGTTATTVTPTVSGLLSGNTVTGLAEVYGDPNVGTGKILSVSSYTVNDGNGGNKL